ncbi:Aste57867_83 [Aphanomyces stellatus]|uniref:Aste57867_83 protein n=1 Tax=Aphanomyces stellatus TaxID=120398 RepID=A0A485K4Q4_9STRA|nr:hypothetical protein As57867_000083 [Aphanomyces stellatus]VFT77309.1 Aste57867_83 [Aphanomyces stellatus]
MATALSYLHQNLRCAIGANSAQKNNLRSVLDVLRIGSGGFWPAFERFHGYMSSGNRLVLVSIHGRRMGCDVVERSYSICAHLTPIFDEACVRLRIRRDVAVRDAEPASHAFVQDEHVPFELWPRRIVVMAAYHGPIQTTPQTTCSEARLDYPAARTYMRLFRKSMRLLTPMLPVNARFAFRQQADPASLLCSHGCGAIETEAYALRDCAVVAPIWDLLTKAWRCVGAGFSWHNFNNLDGFAAINSGTAHRHRMWVMLTGVSLHFVWHRHNLALHRHQRMPPHVLLELSFHDAKDVDCLATVAAILSLLRQPPYLALHAKYLRCLALESTFDVH